jgi:hypothetical protein
MMLLLFINDHPLSLQCFVNKYVQQESLVCLSVNVLID